MIRPDGTEDWVFPKTLRAAARDFEFSTSSTSSNFPLEFVSFSRDGAHYDLTSTDQVEYLRWSPREAGLAKTVDDGKTDFHACASSTVYVDFSPIRKYLRLPKDASFSDAFPAKTSSGPRFKIVDAIKYDEAGAKIHLKYPITQISPIDASIRKFVGTCSLRKYPDMPGTECRKNVEAHRVGANIITIDLDVYKYPSGGPHGDFDRGFSIFLHENKRWHSIEARDLIVASPFCLRKINSLILRRLAPLNLEDLNGLFHGRPAYDYLLGEAQIYLAPRGLKFYYPPWGVSNDLRSSFTGLLPWRDLRGCLRIH